MIKKLAHFALFIVCAIRVYRSPNEFDDDDEFSLDICAEGIQAEKTGSRRHSPTSCKS